MNTLGNSSLPEVLIRAVWEPYHTAAVGIICRQRRDEKRLSCNQLLAAIQARMGAQGERRGLAWQCLKCSFYASGCLHHKMMLLAQSSKIFNLLPTQSISLEHIARLQVQCRAALLYHIWPALRFCPWLMNVIKHKRDRIRSYLFFLKGECAHHDFENELQD